MFPRFRPEEKAGLREGLLLDALKQRLRGGNLPPKADNGLKRLELNLLRKAEEPRVEPYRLAEFEKHMPPWVRESLDPFPPDSAERRLRILYRMVFPPGEELPAPAPPKKPAAPPRNLPQTSRERPGQDHFESVPRRPRHPLDAPGPGRGGTRARPGRAEPDGRRRRRPRRRPIAVGHHDRFGGPHAEVVALERAGDGGAGLDALRNPRTLLPPRQDAPLRRGDPPGRRGAGRGGDPRPVPPRGGRRLRPAGGGRSRWSPRGLEADAARRLNAPYLKRLATGRPYVIAKWAMTLDGKTAAANGESKWISGPRSRAHVHDLRGRMDGIAVGDRHGSERTIPSSPPGRPAPASPPGWCSTRPDACPWTSKLARTAREVPVWVAVTDRAPADRRAGAGSGWLRAARASLANGTVPIGPLLDELGRRGLTNLLVEGGGRVLGAFLDAGEVDAVEVYIAPIVEGGDHSFTPARGAGVASMSAGIEAGAAGGRLARRRHPAPGHAGETLAEPRAGLTVTGEYRYIRGTTRMARTVPAVPPQLQALSRTRCGGPPVSRGASDAGGRLRRVRS